MSIKIKVNRVTKKLLYPISLLALYGTPFCFFVMQMCESALYHIYESHDWKVITKSSCKTDRYAKLLTIPTF